MQQKLITPQTLKHRAIAQYHSATSMIIISAALVLSVIAFVAGN